MAYPDTAHTTELARRFYQKKVSSGYYDPTEGTGLLEKNSLSGANLVSSRTQSGLHAPVLDLDIPSALVRTTAGYNLWVDTNMNALTHELLLRKLKALGLSTGSLPGWRETRRAERLLQWAEERPLTLDDSLFHEVLVALGPETTAAASLETLMLVARNTSAEPAVHLGPEMENPWRIPLGGQALLVPSTRNWHLYLHEELSWKDYRSLLRQLRQARVLEKDYHRLARERQATFLRLPWVHKLYEGDLD